MAYHGIAKHNKVELKGYILYQSKPGVVIDTTKPIDTAQWDSITFTDSTLLIDALRYGRYVNMVAVYEEGKSDFLQGWTLYAPTAVGIKKQSTGIGERKNCWSIKKVAGGVSIIPQLNIENANLGIYNVTGKRIAHFSTFTGNRIVWNASEHHIPTGLYLLRAEFTDRSVITQPFTITR